MTSFDVTGFLSKNGDDSVANSQENKLVSVGKTTRCKDWLSARRAYQKWTKEETDHLLLGCSRHGVGNWKAILSDPELRFNGRSTVDLKDRFRISVPEDYRRLYPGTAGKPTRVKDFQVESNTRKVKRRDRVPFAPIEDESLVKGYQKHGPRWAEILEDPELAFDTKRVRSDLRDRFRLLDPDAYADRQAMFDETAAFHVKVLQSERSKAREQKRLRKENACKNPQQRPAKAERWNKASVTPQQTSCISHDFNSADSLDSDAEMKSAMNTREESDSTSPQFLPDYGLSYTGTCTAEPLLSSTVEDGAVDTQAQIQKLIWDPIYQHHEDR